MKDQNHQAIELTTVTCAMPAHYFLSVARINTIDLSGRAELIQISLWISTHWEFLGKMKVVRIISRIIVVKEDRS